MVFLLRQHGVYCVLIDIPPLPEWHPLHLWYNRMAAVAVTLIWDNLSEETQNDRSVQLFALKSDPRELWEMLSLRFGDWSGAWCRDPNLVPGGSAVPRIQMLAMTSSAKW
ncbi:hypothetical protein N7467_000486 [Penicillium canescens]|nr:hypothetical protein N7467_000486 [Penicillium canescens]